MSGFVTPSKMLTVEDVAVQIGCIPSYVRHLCARAMIAHYKIGKFLRFDQEHVDAFLAKHKVEVFVQPDVKPKRRVDALGLLGL